MTLHDLLEESVHQVAPALIGWTLLVDGVGGPIVEVEAYREDDPASHSYGGPRGRNVVMFGPPGRLYVYRSYGVHWVPTSSASPRGPVPPSCCAPWSRRTASRRCARGAASTRRGCSALARVG